MISQWLALLQVMRRAWYVQSLLLIVRKWYTNHTFIRFIFLPPFIPFFNSLQECFSARQCKLYVHNSYVHVYEPHWKRPTSANTWQASMWHACRFFPCWLARENISCDVGENQRQTGQVFFFYFHRYIQQFAVNLILKAWKHVADSFHAFSV